MNPRSKIFFPISLSVVAAILLMVHFTSCNTDTSLKKQRVFTEYGEWMDSLLLTKDKIIRGVEPGSGIEEVRLMEKRAASEEDSTFLYYEFPVDSLTAGSVNYLLSNQIVQEIELTVSSTDAERAGLIYADLKKYFTSRFTDPVSEKGISVFSGFTSKGENVKVSLEDMSTTSEGKIAVLVYAEK